MSTAVVLSNRDLTRAILGHHSKAVKLLATSREQREDECRPLFVQWAQQGCPPMPSTALEAQCLAALGGASSELCRGTWELKWRGGRVTREVDSRHVADVLATELRTVEKSVLVTLGTTQLRLHRQETSARYILVATVEGWRRKKGGAMCRPAQLTSLLLRICSQTGAVTLPCSRLTQAPISVVVPRHITLESRWNGVTELTCTRR